MVSPACTSRQSQTGRPTETVIFFFGKMIAPGSSSSIRKQHYRRQQQQQQQASSGRQAAAAAAAAAGKRQVSSKQAASNQCMPLEHMINCKYAKLTQCKNETKIDFFPSTRPQNNDIIQSLKLVVMPKLNFFHAHGLPIRLLRADTT